MSTVDSSLFKNISFWYIEVWVSTSTYSCSQSKICQTTTPSSFTFMASLLQKQTKSSSSSNCSSSYSFPAHTAGCFEHDARDHAVRVFGWLGRFGTFGWLGRFHWLWWLAALHCSTSSDNLAICIWCGCNNSEDKEDNGSLGKHDDYVYVFWL